MKKLVLGIIIGIAIMLAGKVYADQTTWFFDMATNRDQAKVVKIIDGDTRCYIYQGGYSGVSASGGVSCVRVK